LRLHVFVSRQPLDWWRIYDMAQWTYWIRFLRYRYDLGYTMTTLLFFGDAISIQV